MENNITDEQLISLIEGEQNKELESQIAEDSTLKKRYNELKEVFDAIETSGEAEVPFHIQTVVQAAIENEKNKKSQLTWLQIAAAVALLIIGFGAGKISSVDASSELTELKQEVRSLKEVTLTNTLQRHSASERIMAVNRIEEGNTIDSRLISTLITTLNSDESPNVRYAALQALKKFISNEEVKAELVKSLGTQTDPLIQISLINVLVEAEERSAIAPLKEIMEKEQVAPEVKQQAEVAIQVLT